MRPFIPAWLDESGLTPVQLRVLIHLWRRADPKTGKCWPGSKSIAQKCKIDRDSLWPALAELERRGLLRREVRTGTSNAYYMLPPTEGGGIGGPPPATGLAESAGPPPAESAGGVVAELTGHKVAESAGLKGTPIKETYRKKPKEGLAPGGSAPRTCDPAFDALASVEGIALAQITPATGKRIGVALAEIKRASPGVTAEEIQRRAANYRRHFDRAALTASALAKWWGRCDAVPAGSGKALPLMR